MVEVLTFWLGSAASIALAGFVLVGSRWGFDSNSPLLLWALGVLWFGSLAVALNTRVIVSATELIVVNGLRRRTVLFDDIGTAAMAFPFWTLGVPVAAIHGDVATARLRSLPVASFVLEIGCRSKN